MAEDTTKVADVSRPGTTPPDASAKPIIVSHKPMMKDPMVNENSAETDVPAEEKSKTPLNKDGNKVIEPLEKTDDKSEKEEKTEETPENEEVAVVEAVLDQKDGKKKSVKETQDAAEKNDQFEKLVESKKYFVKVRAPKRRRNKRVLITIVVVSLFALVGFGMAADAEMVDVDVPFDFIKVQQPETAVIAPSSSKIDQSIKSADPQSDGVKAFESKELGLSFNYPSNTGMEPTVIKTDETFTKSGTAYALTLRQKLSGYAFNADWQPVDAIAVSGEYNDCLSTDKTTKVTVTFYAGDDYCIKSYDYIDYSSDQNGLQAAVVKMQKKITTPTGIVFVEVTSAPIGLPGENNFSESNLKEALGSTAEELKTVAESLKPLNS